MSFDIITPDFIDQVVYNRTVSLASKGSPYTSGVLRELIDYKVLMLGELYTSEISAAIDIQERIEKMEAAVKKLRVLAEMDGGLDKPASEEAIEIFMEAVIANVSPR